MHAVFLFVLAAAIAFAEVHSGSVRFGGQPVPGATVVATQADAKFSTVTDEAGVYRFDKLPASGMWTIEIRMTGFRPLSQTVDAKDAKQWTLELAPRPAVRPAVTAAKPRAGFQRVAVAASDNVDQAMLEAQASAQPELQASNANTNEAFLVNGSVSGGLQTGLERGAGEGREFDRGFGLGMGPGMGPGMGDGMGAGIPGLGGGFGGGGGDGVGRGSGRGGPGGPGGGPPGGFGGPGRGGPPGGGRGPGGRGPGGGGGPGGGEGFGRGGPGGRRPPSRGEMVFGNRAGRGRQGIRGGLSYSLANSAFDARPFSLTGDKVEKASYSQNRINLMAGGALIIPKLVNSPGTFFFVTYSGNIGRNPFQATQTLPTAAERAGDFTASARNSVPVQIYDPLNRAPFAGNRVPSTRLDPIANGLLRYYPLPNQAALVQNYQYVTSVNQNSQQLGLRVNRSIGRADRFDLNTNFQFRDATNAQVLGFRDTTDGAGLSAGLGWTRTLSRTVVNSVRLNFSRNRSELIPFFAFGRNVAAELGIGGVATNPINYGPPNLNFTNYAGLTDGSPSLRRDQTLSVSDALTWVRGAHNLSFGGELRRLQLNNRTDQNARGTFTFSGVATSAFNAQGQPLPATGFDFADFLLGLPQSSSVRFGGTNTYFRTSVLNGFISDDWRILPNLTVNAGLRYEYFQPFHEKYDQIANLDISPAFDAVAVVTPGQSGPYSGAYPRGLVDGDKNNFSPRLAFAWRPLPKKQFQVRGGYGVFYNGSVYNQFVNRLSGQPPFAPATATVNTSLARTLTLANGFGTTPTQSITNTFAVDRNYLTGYAQTFNLSLQQSLPHNLVLEVGYLGTKGTRLDIQRLPNRAPAGSTQTAEQRRLIGNAVGFTYDTSDGNSIYHAGTVRLSRRFARGIGANLNYTYGKSLDNASTFGGAGNTVAQNDRDLRAERGRSSFDQRHQLQLSYVLTSPVRETGALFANSAALRKAFRNWNLSGGVTASSGTPLTARVLGNQSDTAGTGVVGAGRADATGLDLYTGGRFFNPAAFAIPRSGTFGNAARNLIDGPNRITLNLSFGRSFQIADRKSIEVRAESQNFTNKVNYTNVGTVVNALTYGLATNVGQMRTIGLSVRMRF